MAEASKKTSVVVIGGGPGGYAAAFQAAELGLKVTLVDVRENPGGVCLNVGCIPSKALLHVADLLTEARHVKEVGVEFAEPAIDLDRLSNWKDEVVHKLTSGLGQLARRRKVEYVQGRAHFLDANSLSIEGETKTVLNFDYAIVATGSRPSKVPGIDLVSERLMDSTSALNLPDVPERLLVVGGGYIGLELGTVYAALGSGVTVVELLDGLLPGVDRDLVRPLMKHLKTMMASIHLETKVTAMRESAGGISVQLEGTVSGFHEYDRVLVAVGRSPNTENLGLETIDVTLDHGFIQIDSQCRTSQENVFAIGDVAGQPMLAHKAMREGKVAAEVIAGLKSSFDNQAIPAVVFTDPEVAWTGLTETEALSQQIPVKVAKFPWAASGRALTLGRTDGLTKMLFDPESGRVLGVGIVGPNAGELIAEPTLAIEMAAVAEDLALTIHAHPTLSETVGEVAELFLGHATHIFRK